MDNTFLWHDYETFGKVARSDRPAQFAAIRTDMDLNEIEKPVVWYCKPTPDVLPSIEACLITGITPQHCLEHGVIEREFAMYIEHELAKDQTIGVGFNSIRFDDEVTRHLFWRNLIDPYAREWQNGCGRWDLMDVVRALYAFLPDSINWLQNEEGVVSLKLESLSKANHLSHDQVHDALSDVRATIALAKLIKTAQPKFFNFCLNLRNKENVRAQLREKKPVLHVSSMYGGHRAYLAVVWPLAEHPTNKKNEVIVWDLAEDPSILADLTAEEIKARIFTKENRLPIKTIGINKSPFIAADLRVLRKERAVQLNIDMDLIQRHAEMAQKLMLSPTVWAQVYARQFDKADVDEDLYSALIPNGDRGLLNSLRTMSAQNLATAHPKFQDNRLEELFFRYRARNFPDNLSDSETQRWQRVCFEKCGSRLADYVREIETALLTATTEQKTILLQLEAWAQTLNR